MRILVTGADGYIGRGVVNQLLGSGHSVIAMGLNSCGIRHDHLEEYVGDVFSFDLNKLTLPTSCSIWRGEMDSLTMIYPIWKICPSIICLSGVPLNLGFRASRSWAPCMKLGITRAWWTRTCHVIPLHLTVLLKMHLGS